MTPMTGKLYRRALSGLLLAWGGAAAADFAAPPTASALPVQFAPPPSGQPAQPAPRPAAAEPAPQPPTEEGEAPAGANPHMMGDFPTLFVLRTFNVPALRTISTTQTVTQTSLVTVIVIRDGQRFPVQVPVTTTSQVPVQLQGALTVPVAVRVPFPFEGDFKVAENESPRPQDRVFFNYNFYGHVAGPNTSAAVTSLNTVTTTLGGNPAVITTLTPGVPAPRFDLHREVVGFEKTFLGGDASVELRAPVLEQEGADAIDGSNFGDLTVVTKYAFLNDRATGDVLSAGLAVTLPTGPGVPLPGGKLHSTLLQPWGGYVWNVDRFYVHGFTSLVVPTDSRDVTLLFNDVGAGYRLYQAGGDRLISAVVPTLEVHVTTPLNHGDTTSLVTVPDLVVLTAGSHFDIYRSSTLSVGVATPLTGPRVFDVEALVQFNWRF
jgi:hypothetical protein